MNFFEQLKVPATYKIDRKVLEENYLSEVKECNSLQNAQDVISLKFHHLNQMYSVLKSDIKRVDYMLKMANIDVADFKLDEQFYETILTLKDQLDELDQVDNGADEMHQTLESVKDLIRDCNLELEKQLTLKNLIGKTSDDSVVGDIMQEALKLKYLTNLRKQFKHISLSKTKQ